jgi:hypothetical protein
MATQKTIPEIIQIAKMSVTLAANKVGNDICGRGRTPDRTIHRDIYTELVALEYLYANYPSENFTREVAEYVYHICFPFSRQAENIIDNLGGTPPVVSGPADESVMDGTTASFSISVTSTTAYTVQWYRNGVPISGATSNTYSFTADLADTGDEFFAIATNPAGSTTSQTATLTVTAVLTGHYYVGDTDYYTLLNLGLDNIDFNDTFNIVDGEPLSITISDEGDTLGNNKSHVYKYPTSQGAKTTWYNTVLNNGSIPDQAFRTIITIGDYHYIVSRGQISVDTGSPMIFT